MPQPLDVPLDDLIGKTKKPGGYHGHFRGRGRGYCPGPTRGLMNNPFRTTPYCTTPKMPVARSLVVSEGAGTEEGTKLYVSNLDYDVSNSDIEFLFSDIGHLKRHSIHYDRSGRSKGTAEVIFVHHSDALTAIKKYNNVQLDGKPMKIELVGVNPVIPVPVPPRTSSLLGQPNILFQSARGRVGARGLSRARGTGGFGLARGRGQVRERAEKVTVEDLDADLERYRRKAMQIE